MQFGLYLKGGGAKGAFQAGLLCAFRQRGLSYSVIAGTSIGAVNGWFVLHNAYEEMEKLYTGSAHLMAEHTLKGMYLDNSLIIDSLRDIPGERNRNIRGFFVNYVSVSKGMLQEKVEDIANKDSDYALERIRWSGLLPYNQPEMTFSEYVRFTGQHDTAAIFKKDLEMGVYEGSCMDGGLINNQFIPELFQHTEGTVIALGYNGTREDYLQGLPKLPPEKQERILYITSDNPFQPTDTFNFTPEFLQMRFREGYEKGMAYPLFRLMD